MRYTFGDYILDSQRYELHRAGKPVPLRPKAFEVLAYLLAHRDHVVPKDELLEHLWPSQFVGDATLNSCIKEVRKAIGDSGVMSRLLRTVRGRGYRFVAPVGEQDHPRPEGVPQLAPSPAVLAAREGSSPPTPAAAASEADLSPADVLDAGEEYKAVTVLCVALAEAPALAGRLGPEAMHRVMQAVVAHAQEVVRRYEGTIVHVTGEGFTALFGAPMAQEDHARRAVLAALELRQRLHDHPAIRAHTGGEALATRMGLHTGPAVVGRLPREPQRLYTATGVTTHLTARLQQLATPGAILISAATSRLVQAEVHVEVCASLDSDGRSPAVPAYAVQGVVQQRAGVPGWGGRPLSRFVGRARELAVLHACLVQAAQGQGQVVGVAGEPGMGKSRFLYEFAQSLSGRPVTYREAHCLAYGSATPYLTVRALLRQACGLSEADGPEVIAVRVHRYLQEAGGAQQDEAPLLLELLDVPVDAPRLASLDPKARKARTFALLQQITLHEGQRRPLVLAVENLHWIDATSEEWLATLVDRLAGAAILLLTTYRPGYRPPWMDKSYATQLALPRLTPHDSLAVVRSVSRTAPIPDRLTQEIIAKAAGNPFFLEELARSALEEGDCDGALTIPDTIQAVLGARIDRLPPAEKRLLQTMAVIGKDVPFPFLLAGAEAPEEALHRSLSQLQTAEFLNESQLLPTRIYTFKHALIQEVAYQSLLQSTRRDIHRRIARALAEGFPDVAATQPELLAHHYTEAGLSARAVVYWQRAGDRAIQRSANVEAIAHLTRGLDLLKTLPDTPERRRQELHLQVALGAPLTATKGRGAPETRHVYTRARELCRQVGETPELARVLYGLWDFYNYSGELQTALEVGEELLRLAQSVQDPVHLLQAHRALGGTLFWRGAMVPALTHLEQGMAFYDPANLRSEAFKSGHAAGVACLSHGARMLWALGYPAQALKRNQRALTLAHEVAHPASLAYAHTWTAMLHQLRRERQAAREQAELAVVLSSEHGLAQFWAGAMILRGWALADQGQIEQGLAEMRRGLAAWRSTGAGLVQPYWLALVAEVCRKAGQPTEGLTALSEALALVDKNGQRYYEAELYRLKADLLLGQATPDAAQAEACFQQALDVACRQQAKSWELRAAMSLSRLWQCQGKSEQACQILAEVYGWFTEGFETADLQEAKSLLHDLAG